MPKALLVAVALVCCVSVPLCAETWNVLVRDGASRSVPPYLSSLAGGETGVGAVRSETFTLDADTVSFEMCGADGWPGRRNFKSWFALCDADTGLALRRIAPPGHDSMTPVKWDVVELVGRQVYFRAVDGLDITAFAWIGWHKVRVGERELMPSLERGRIPEGWIEEKQPEGMSAAEWLECKQASSKWAMEDDEAGHSWGVIDYNGIRQETEPYLCSLKGGESGTGAVRSPTFVLDTPEYTFVGMGADTPTGDAGLNSFQLVDAATMEILRRSPTHVGNALLPITWDTSDLVGRRVFFRAVDRNNAPSWAWIGCDRVPLGKDRVAVFAEPGALEGWREEGLGGGLLADSSKLSVTLAETIETEWSSEDVQRGVRWALWESNEQAAPYIMRRLARIMAGDFARGDQLIRDFRQTRDARRRLRDYRVALRGLERRFEALRERPRDIEAWKALRREQRVLLRRLAFENPLLDFDDLLFVKRFTQQTYADINVNHHAWGSRPGGDICILTGFRATQSVPPGGPDSLPAISTDPRSTVVSLIRARLGPGNVHGIDLDWDAKRVLFAYARADSDQPPDGWLSRQRTFDLHRTVGLLHLYEMNIDGSDLRQLTDGEWSDLNPCYLPSGDIAFESERCGFELQCNEYDKDEPTTNLYVMRPDGSHQGRRLVPAGGPRRLNRLLPLGIPRAQPDVPASPVDHAA